MNVFLHPTQVLALAGLREGHARLLSLKVHLPLLASAVLVPLLASLTRRLVGTVLFPRLPMSLAVHMAIFLILVVSVILLVPVSARVVIPILVSLVISHLTILGQQTDLLI